MKKRINSLSFKPLLLFVLMLILTIGGIQTSFATALGQELPIPSSGWTRIDDHDPALLFSNGTNHWMVSQPEHYAFGYYKSTYTDTLTNVTNQTVSFSFTGSKLIIGAFGGNLSTGFNVNIDGIDYGNHKTHYGVDKVLVVYENTQLENAAHVVTLRLLPISVIGGGSVVKTDSYISLDYIDIDANGKMLTPPVQCTALSQSKVYENITIGNTKKLSLQFSPSNSFKNVKWTSSNPTIATVDSSGTVTALSLGKAHITATTQDGSNLSAICEVSVIDTSTPVSKISLSKSTLSLLTGGSDTLTAILIPDNATNKQVTWSSSNPAIATVSAAGVINAITPGSVTITATTSDDSNLNATCNLTVTEPSKGRAILTIKFTNGIEKDYDLTISQVNSFIDWYETKSSGTGKASFALPKNKGAAPFSKRTDYVIFDKIYDFNVDEYETK